MAIVIAQSLPARAMPEYTAAEAPKHIGQKATVVGRVECISAGRTFHSLELDGCSPNSPFWIIVNDDASGPPLDVQELQDVTIAVTGQIEKRDVYSHPWMVVKTTSQIVARTPKQTDYIGRAYDKEQKGDIDGAIADLNEAIEHQPKRRDEACEHLAMLKDKQGDWAGALAAYDKLIAFKPNDGGPYYSRAVAKKQHADFDGAMADFSRAAELRASGVSLIDIGNMRKANGDSAGGDG
jgi:tetratricopeptide (TPR) repeat protein